MRYEAAEAVDRHESGAQCKNRQVCCKVSVDTIVLRWCGHGNGTISCLQVHRWRVLVFYWMSALAAQPLDAFRLRLPESIGRQRHESFEASGVFHQVRIINRTPTAVRNA